LFEKYKVDFYIICGHEHTLQHLEMPQMSTSLVVAGGGGAKRKPMLRDQRWPFSKSTLGFADMHFDSSEGTLSWWIGTARPCMRFDDRDQGRYLDTADFDYTGAVDVSDLGDLASNYGGALAGATSIAQPTVSVDVSASTTAVPKPLSLGLFGIAACGLFRRYRTRRC
jgi:hypothetical protein